MIAVRSPRDLLQEEWYPDDLRVLVCCILLNRTRGDQARPVAASLFDRYADAESLSSASSAELSELLKPLGFHRQRAEKLRKLANAYLGNWSSPTDLPGVGVYAARCYEIMFLERLGDEPPDDHALLDYWIWAKAGGWPEGGWGYDPLVEARRSKPVRATWSRWNPHAENWIPSRGPLLSSEPLIYCHTKSVGGSTSLIYRRVGGHYYSASPRE